MMVDNISGWWFQPSPLKNHGVKVSWDDMTFPTVSGKSYLIHSMVPVTTNQIYIYIYTVSISLAQPFFSYNLHQTSNWELRGGVSMASCG